jgi:hypothetical protein
MGKVNNLVSCYVNTKKNFVRQNTFLCISEPCPVWIINKIPIDSMGQWQNDLPNLRTSLTAVPTLTSLSLSLSYPSTSLLLLTLSMSTLMSVASVTSLRVSLMSVTWFSCHIGKSLGFSYVTTESCIFTQQVRMYSSTWTSVTFVTSVREVREVILSGPFNVVHKKFSCWVEKRVLTVNISWHMTHTQLLVKVCQTNL